MSTETSCHFGHLLLVSSFWKIHCFTFLPYKCIRDQIWPCRKIGHGQPRVIIWTNFVVLEHSMLHTKFQGHRPFGSGEEDFLRFLPYTTLIVWPGPFEQIFIPPSHGDSIWNLASVVSEEKMLKECGWRTGRQTDAWGLPILLAHQWAFGSGELKIAFWVIFRLVSSPEPKAHTCWWAYSIGRHPLSVVVVRLSTVSNNISSEAMKPILTKFHIQHL